MDLFGPILFLPHVPFHYEHALESVCAGITPAVISATLQISISVLIL